MDFLGGVEGMKFAPVSNYNNYLKSNVAFDVDSDMSFENILNKQAGMMQNSNGINGGVQMDTMFDDLLNKNTVQASSESSSTGNFMKNIASSLGGGLNAVNNSVQSAHKAQEAMAMGENVSVHDVMIASEKASLSMGMAVQLRNKVLSAYTEINNVRV